MFCLRRRMCSNTQHRALPRRSIPRACFSSTAGMKQTFSSCTTSLRSAGGLDLKASKAEAWGGRILIEKFAGGAREAAFTVASVTPDDTVRASHAQYVQGRPNVIFELGWFYGRLGRKRVTIVLNKGTQLHSDPDGVSRVEFGSSVEEAALALEVELKAAGMI